MKVTYFGDTDTLYIELKSTPPAVTRDLDENTLLDVDANGLMCAITIEHASTRVDLPKIRTTDPLELLATVP